MVRAPLGSMRLALLALVSSVVGCLAPEEECDDCFGYLELSWRFVASDGTPSTCPADASIEVTMSPSGSGRDEHHSYPCADLRSSAFYDGGFFDLVVEVTDGSGSVLARDARGIQIPILGQRLPVDLVFQP